MDLSVKFGIIGCSDVARRITVPTMMHSTNVKLSMVGSRSVEKSKAWAKKFEVMRMYSSNSR